MEANLGPCCRIASALCAALALAACSVMPHVDWRPHEDRLVEVEYRFEKGRDHWVTAPASGPDLTVFELGTIPAVVDERHANGARELLVPRDCATLLLRCRYRAYGAPGQPPSSPELLFPGAATVRVLE